MDLPTEAKIAEAGDTLVPFSMFEEISSFLLWVSVRWPVLALYGLVMATMLWMDFIQLFDLPVSFISPGMLTALPILGLSVGVPVATLMVVVACTAAALWLPLTPGGLSLMAWTNTARTVEVEHGARPPDLFNRWLILSVLQAVYWPAWFGLRYLTTAIPADAVWPTGCVVSLAAGFWLFWPVFRAASPGVRPGGRYLSVFALNVLFQTSIATLLVVPVLAGAETNRPVVVAFHAEAYVFILIGIALSQLLTSKLFTRGWRHDLLKKGFVLVMGVLGFLLGFPGAGGTLAAYRLRIEGPGHSTCMRLQFQSAGPVSPPVVVLDKGNPARSIPLNFVTRLDDAYYVKVLPQQGPTFVVPAASVTGITACSAVAAASLSPPVMSQVPSGPQAM